MQVEGPFIAKQVLPDGVIQDDRPVDDVSILGNGDIYRRVRRSIDQGANDRAVDPGLIATSDHAEVDGPIARCEVECRAQRRGAPVGPLGIDDDRRPSEVDGLNDLFGAVAKHNHGIVNGPGRNVVQYLLQQRLPTHLSEVLWS